MTLTLPLTLVVAMAENRVIGRDNGLIWRIKSDLKYFKANTIGRPVIMGRKTYLSIGRPLPGRENIVLTRDPDFSAIGVHPVRSIDEALELGIRLGVKMGASDIVVAGGADVYAQLLPQAHKIILTLVHAKPEGDAYFPAFEHMDFKENFRETHEAGPDDQYSFTYITYQRA
jgi:dihydrofolate reductase